MRRSVDTVAREVERRTHDSEPTGNLSSSLLAMGAALVATPVAAKRPTAWTLLAENVRSQMACAWNGYRKPTSPLQLFW
jgi:hypothetical protein